MKGIQPVSVERQEDISVCFDCQLVPVQISFSMLYVRILEQDLIHLWEKAT